MMPELVLEGDDLGGDDDFLRQVGRDDDDSLAAGQNDVAGKHGRRADPDRPVDRGQDDVLEERGIPAPDTGVEPLDLLQTVQVAGAGVEHHAGARLGEDRVAQVVADERAVGHLAEPVGNVDVALLEHVDRPGVRRADPTFLLAGPHDSIDEIGPAGKIGGRQSPTDEGLVGMDHLPAADELILITALAQDIPGLLDRDGLHAPQQVVGDPGPSIRTPITLPLGRHGGQLDLRRRGSSGRFLGNRSRVDPESGAKGRQRRGLSCHSLRYQDHGRTTPHIRGGLDPTRIAHRR